MQVVVAYNDSRGRNASPINISGASVSTDGGATFTRVTTASGQSPFAGTEGDPVVLYNRANSTWFTVWLDTGCGAQGLGGYKSTNPSDPTSWTHFCVHGVRTTGSLAGRTTTHPLPSPTGCTFPGTILPVAEGLCVSLFPVTTGLPGQWR